MNVIVCIDDRNGIMFNNRRLSQDSKIFEDMKNYLQNNILYCSEYTSKILEKNEIDYRISKTNSIKDNNFYFAENEFPPNNLINQIIVYKWNKNYPFDKKINVDFTKYKILNITEFNGSSHDKITRIIYIRSNKNE